MTFDNRVILMSEVSKRWLTDAEQVSQDELRLSLLEAAELLEPLDYPFMEEFAQRAGFDLGKIKSGDETEVGKYWKKFPAFILLRPLLACTECYENGWPTVNFNEHLRHMEQVHAWTGLQAAEWLRKMAEQATKRNA